MNKYIMIYLNDHPIYFVVNSEARALQRVEIINGGEDYYFAPVLESFMFDDDFCDIINMALEARIKNSRTSLTKMESKFIWKLFTIFLNRLLYKKKVTYKTEFIPTGEFESYAGIFHIVADLLLMAEITDDVNYAQVLTKDINETMKLRELQLEPV